MTALQRAPLPVILDTDIGGDIDDMWALVMLLNSPEVDVKLVVADHGDTLYRARLLAKMLEIAGRTDVPVGIGPRSPMRRLRQAEWLGDYDLARYPGRVLEDGVGAIVDTIMNSPLPVTLITIGPLDNIAEALEREPSMVGKARHVGMCGSIREQIAEANVRARPDACRKVLSASWESTIAPTDACRLVRLHGEKYAAVLQSEAPLAVAIIENYRIWAKGMNAEGWQFDPDVHSSTLWDTVAVYLAFSEDLLAMERLGLRVTDEGRTLVDPGAKKVNCALEWRDLAAFEDLLVQRVAGS